MKPLNEYPTPLADAVAYYSNDTQYGCGGYIVDKEDAQHLERKLALCRDALKSIEDAEDFSGGFIGAEHMDTAAKALDATK